MKEVPRTPATLADADQELAPVLDALDEAVNYADWIVEMAGPHLAGHVLELGAGHGTLTERLVRHAGGAGDDSGRVTVTEVSERCVQTLRQRFRDNPGVEVLHADIDTAVEGRRFDSAVLVNVLEHIADDAAALRRLFRALRPGGTLVLFVPAFESLYSEFDRLVGHHRRYRRDGLTRAVTEAGFEVIDARYVNCVGAVAWWLVVRQLRRFPRTGTSIRAYDRIVTPLVRRLESRWRPPFGQSVLCIGRRPLTLADG